MRKISVLTSILLAGILFLSCSGNAKVEPEAESKAPAAPTGLKLHGEAEETSLTFQWTAVEGAKGYNWKIAKGTTEAGTGKTSNRNVKVENLEKGTTYKFSVQAMADGKVSAWVSVEATTAGESSDDPDSPDGPEVTPDPEAYAKFLIPSVEEDGEARAFPGAEGGGMWATGGRGGKIYHVTSLGDSASEEGTLRYGIEKADRPLTIVFDVAGTIALNSQLNIKKGDLTIAGQTAPGDGICLKNYTFRISASNVVVRFIRCRMGDEKATEDDAIQVMDHQDDKYQNIVIDHCSVSWSTDECASFYGVKDFTFSWNIVSESLRNSVHDKGSHGYGGIWGGTNATYHHNLLAHHDSRNPRLDHDYVSTQKGPVTVLNNVIYNWSGDSTYGGESINNTNTYRQYNLVNNYYKPGPATGNKHIWFLHPTTKCSNCSDPNKTSFPAGSVIVPGHFYMTGNYMNGYNALTSDNWSTLGYDSNANSSIISTIKATSAFAVDTQISVQSAVDGFDAVLNYAGASFHRDAIDTRVTGETRNGNYTYNGSNGSTKGLIDTQTDVNDGTWVNGWPVYAATEAEKDAIRDSDSDGMPNWFEEEFGLNKSGASDAQAYTLDPQKRYTNLEMYLHYIVKDIVKGGNENSEYKKL